MIDPRNFGKLTCGLVADPEYVGANNSVIRFRLAADYAGNDRDDANNRSGYFNAVYFVNDNNPINKFITGQMSNGNLSRGSQVEILYTLQQNRWTDQNGKKQSTVELVIEGMSYAGSKSNSSSGDKQYATAGAASGGEATSITEF